MNSKKVIIDCGKFATKGIVLNKDGQIALKSNGEPNRVYFQTKIDKTPSPSDDKELCPNVEYKGIKYIVGDGDNNNTTDKGTETHKICLLTAISKLVDNGTEVDLTYGCPASIFLNPAMLKELADNLILKDGKDIKIKVNDKDHHFKIRNLKFLPEGLGIIYTNPSYKKGYTLVIDIGGWNTNIVLFKNGNPVRKATTTLNNGGYQLIEIIKKGFSQSGKNLGDIFGDDYILQGIIAGDILTNSGKSYIPNGKDIIKKSKNTIIDKIYTEVQRIDESLFELCSNIIFTGGTSEVLKEEILERFPFASIAENATWVNVEGFAKCMTET